MDQNEIKIRVAEAKVTDRASRGRRQGFPWLLCIGVLAIVGVVGALFMRSGQQPLAKPAATGQVRPESVEATAGKAMEARTPVSTAADDGESLWISPTAGQPLELRYLLPGTQWILHVRVAELLSHAEGEKILAALGPWGQQKIQELTESSGIALSAVETLLLGIRPTRTGPLEYALCLRTTDSISNAEPGPGYFMPAGAEGKTLVRCSASAVTALKEQGAEPPL
ncbi:MAG: hypothetical protein ACR2NM_10985, partial [Bythopirellula sp.]